MTDPTHRHGYDSDDLMAWRKAQSNPPCCVCGDTGEVRWTDDDGEHGPFPCEDCSK